jgi:hypothetical protein
MGVSPVQAGGDARLSMIAPLFLTSALFAHKFLVKNVRAANAIADDMGSFDSVRLPPHFAQDDNKFESESGCINFFPID